MQLRLRPVCTHVLVLGPGSFACVSTGLYVVGFSGAGKRGEEFSFGLMGRATTAASFATAIVARGNFTLCVLRTIMAICFMIEITGSMTVLATHIIATSARVRYPLPVLHEVFYSGPQMHIGSFVPDGGTGSALPNVRAFDAAWQCNVAAFRTMS